MNNDFSPRLKEISYMVSRNNSTSKTYIKTFVIILLNTVLQLYTKILFIIDVGEAGIKHVNLIQIVSEWVTV